MEIKELTNLEAVSFSLVKNPLNPHAVLTSINVIKKEETENDKS